jgi:hypothetical protein
MSRYWLPTAALSLCWLSAVAIGQAQKPAETPADSKNIEYALKLTVAAAGEYEIKVGEGETAKGLEMMKEPVLKWSNPDRGEIHGNVFLWTRDGRPLVVGSLHKWFSPFTHMSHEFHSFAEEPLAARFHGKEVWETSEPGVHFADVPGAPAFAAGEAQQLLQMKQLAKEFSGSKSGEREDPKAIELRLLTQPIHRYSAPKQGLLSGGLFALVHGTDPEIFLLIEARGKDAATARWQYAATRMTGVTVLLRHKDQKIWSSDALPSATIHDHKHAYTTFMFKEIPDFLREAADKPSIGK